MPLNFGTQLGGDQSIGFPNPNQNQTPKDWSAVGTAGNVTLYTVPAGKKVYISGFIVGSKDNSAQRWKFLRDAAVLNEANVPTGDSVSISFPTAMLFSAGEAIAWFGGVANLNITVFGWEE